MIAGESARSISGSQFLSPLSRLASGRLQSDYNDADHIQKLHYKGYNQTMTRIGYNQTRNRSYRKVAKKDYSNISWKLVGRHRKVTLTIARL